MLEQHDPTHIVPRTRDRYRTSIGGRVNGRPVRTTPGELAHADIERRYLDASDAVVARQQEGAAGAPSRPMSDACDACVRSGRATQENCDLVHIDNGRC